MKTTLTPNKTGNFGFLLITIGLLSLVQPLSAQIPENITSKRLRLSYIAPDRCMNILKVYGFNVGSVGKPLVATKLPVVHPLPGTKFHDTVSAQNSNFPQTETDPINEVIVFYDKNQPEQFGQIARVIEEQIDVPSRQIIIEAMVLELSSTALRELGVQWELNQPGVSNFLSQKVLNTTNNPLTIGSITYPAIGNAAQLDVTTTNIFREFNTRLRALVESGSAQVLSRPSVLTLDNRMASINVSEQIPIAKSRFLSNGNFASIDFANLTAGIQLSVRPRINSSGSEVSMQINASVTARVPGEDLEIKDNKGDVIASSPTLSVREVKTYTRIANSTPFIIGGLIAEDSTKNESKVPILGELPIVSPLFKSRSGNSLKREVIIVITPFVIPENDHNTTIAKHIPKDEDIFDSFGQNLFRDGYRIRAEDTFDLSYLKQNRQLRRLQEKVKTLLTMNPNLKEKYPYKSFAGGGIPGEEILVHRQIYEVVKRLEIDRNISTDNLIFFKPDENLGAGFKVQFLEKFLKKEKVRLSGDGGKTALALTFHLRRFSDDVQDILKEPVPEVSVIECEDKDAWETKLKELNQPAEDGIRRHTILLRSKDDVQRLKRAIVLNKIIELNNAESILSLKSFRRGRQLAMPTVKKSDIELLDADVARCFYYSEQYYQALQQAVDEAAKALAKDVGVEKLSSL